MTSVARSAGSLNAPERSRGSRPGLYAVARFARFLFNSTPGESNILSRLSRDRSLFSTGQHRLHNPNFGALAAVDIRREIKELSVLPGARSVEQVFDHNQGAIVVLNHPGQKQLVELGALCFLKSLHLLLSKHAGHEHR